MDKVELLKQEQTLQFGAFTHDMGLEIAQRIIKKVKGLAGKPVGIRVVHNDLLILHYLMDGRKESPWLNRKEKTVLDSGHSSLYTFLFMDEVPEYKEWESTRNTPSAAEVSRSSKVDRSQVSSAFPAWNIWRTTD